MNADDFRIGVFHGDEDVGLAVGGRDCLRHVRSPQLVDAISDNRPVMRFGLCSPSAMRREQSMFAHDAPHPTWARANASAAQPRPYLAIALAVKTRTRDVTTDMFGQFGVRSCADGAGTMASGARRRLDASTTDPGA